MIRKTLAIAGLLLGALLAGCMHHSMPINVPLLQVARPDADQATIIFMRPSLNGIGDWAPIAQAGQTPPRIVGLLGSREAIIDKVRPGKYAYVVGGYGQNLLSADVEAGKVYIVLVRAYQNFLQSGFILQPEHSPTLQTYMRLRRVKLSVPTPEGLKEYEPGMAEKVKNAMEGFSSRDAFTLFPEDGIPYDVFYRMMK